MNRDSVYTAAPTELNDDTIAKMMAIMGMWLPPSTDMTSPSLATTIEATIARAPTNWRREMSLLRMNLYREAVTTVRKEQRMTQIGGGTRMRPAR